MFQEYGVFTFPIASDARRAPAQYACELLTSHLKCGVGKPTRARGPPRVAGVFLQWDTCDMRACFVLLGPPRVRGARHVSQDVLARLPCDRRAAEEA